MSKTKRLKVDFDDTSEILELMLILKDIATTMFSKSAKKKQVLIDFVQYFIDFFKLCSFVDAKNALVTPITSATSILAVTSESGFMGDMNSRMVRSMIAEAEKNNASDLVVIGNKAGEKVKQMYGKSKNIHVFGNIVKVGSYRTSINVKDYFVENILAGKIGKIVAVYPFALNINLIRPRTAILFPSTELFAEYNQSQKGAEDTIEPVTVESDLSKIMGYLASVWLTCRIYELLMNAECAGFAAQVQQLEGASDRLKKEKLFLGSAVRKSRKADISKSLAETFASRMVTGGS
jgi:F0F1-type ATP synthase gamma subunit